jgi:nitrile hydratase subunit beta
MSRVHDMGGQGGFGSVPVGGDDLAGGDDLVGGGGQSSPADWEMRVAALAAALRRRGTFTGDEFRDAIERIRPADYLAMSYYERWLAAVEMLLAEKELLTGHGPAAHGPAAQGPAAQGPAAQGPAAHGPAAHGPAAHGPTAGDEQAAGG